MAGEAGPGCEAGHTGSGARSDHELTFAVDHLLGAGQSAFADSISDAGFSYYNLRIVRLGFDFLSELADNETSMPCFKVSAAIVAR